MRDPAASRVLHHGFVRCLGLVVRFLFTITFAIATNPGVQLKTCGPRKPERIPEADVRRRRAPVERVAHLISRFGASLSLPCKREPRFRALFARVGFEGA